MAVKSAKKLQASRPHDAEKESIFKNLCSELQSAGIKVRREKLKAGPGWKAISGSCRVLSDKLVFVDPRLPQDEQIMFLRAKAAVLGVSLSSDERSAA